MAKLKHMEQIGHIGDREYDLYWTAGRLADKQKNVWYWLCMGIIHPAYHVTVLFHGLKS